MSRLNRTSNTDGVIQQSQPTPSFTPAVAFARNRETAPAYWFLEILWLVLVDGRETGGAHSVTEQWMRQDSGRRCVTVREMKEGPCRGAGTPSAGHCSPSRLFGVISGAPVASSKKEIAACVNDGRRHDGKSRRAFYHVLESAESGHAQRSCIALGGKD
jgi:hypothetical protein